MTQKFGHSPLSGSAAISIRLWCVLAGLLLSLLPSSRVEAQDTNELKLAPGNGVPRFAAIENVVSEAIAAGEIPGCVVAIVHGEDTVFLRAFGHRQLEPEKLPMSTETVFDMASLTKPIVTATSLMMLVERGDVRLGDRYGRHVPEFKVNGKQDVRIFEMLTHQAGLVPDTPLGQYVDPQQIWPLLYQQALSYPPRTKFVYSDVGYQFLGHLVERKSGKALNEFASENIFQPLGMKETGFLPSESLRKRAATTEQREGRWMQGEVHDPRAYAMGGVAGHAGLFSTASDLTRFARMVLGEGELDGNRILSPASIRTMLTPHNVSGNVRAIGWDVQSRYSTNRGELMSSSAIGHGGFTGTSIWMDPELDLAVVFLSNRVHPDGKGSANRLAGRIGSIAASAVSSSAPRRTRVQPVVRVGADMIEAIDWGQQDLRVGLITNHTGLDSEGRRTIDLLNKSQQVILTVVFSPEHGIHGVEDKARINDAIDEVTRVPIHSLYGANRKPTPESLEQVDALVFDIQDVGTRFYTYVSTMKNAMKAAADSGKRFIVLDRPNPLGGLRIAGPILDAGRESFVGCHPVPVQHGMTVGELAQMFKEECGLALDLQIVPMANWNRAKRWDETGLVWTNPSPNMRNLTEAILYPGIGLLETTNLSVGRGTDRPFETIGSPWIDPAEFAKELNRLELPGVRFVPRRFTPESSKFAGESCGGVDIMITNRVTAEPVRVGIGIATVLQKLYPGDWGLAKMDRLLCDAETLRRISMAETVASIVSGYSAELDAFANRRQRFLLYK